MSTVTKVYTADPLIMAEQCRHAAVRAALAEIVGGTRRHGEPDAMLRARIVNDLTRSVKKCAHLDNRPLDPGRVNARAAATEGACRRW